MLGGRSAAYPQADTPTTRQVFGTDYRRNALISEKEWVEQLYEVRCEPDKLLIMITNRRQALKRLDEGAKNTEQQLQPDTSSRRCKLNQCLQCLR